MPSLCPLEFRECAIDGPRFRKALAKHEEELKYANKRTKCVYENLKLVFNSLGNLSEAMLKLATSLEDYACHSHRRVHLQPEVCTDESQSGKKSSTDSSIGSGLIDTDDDIKMQTALRVYANIIRCIEEARCIMIKPNKEVILGEIEELRQFWLAGHNTNPKAFMKETNTFCQALEKYVSIKPKDYTEAAEARMHDDRQNYLSKAFDYVANIHEAEQLKEFKFIQTISVFVKMLSNFYNEACEQLRDSNAQISQILEAAQRSSENFQQIKDETESLKEKLLHTSWEQIQSSDSSSIREGYVFVLMKKTMATTWVKTFCAYDRKTKVLQLTPYSQIRDSKTNTELYVVVSCVTRPQDAVERRCCFDVDVEHRSTPITMQAQTLADLHEWLLVLDGKEPFNSYSMAAVKDITFTPLTKHIYGFVCQLINVIELKGVQAEGIYRKCGATFQVMDVIKQGLAPSGISNSALDQFTVYVLAGALKYLMRNLDGALIPFNLHDLFVNVARLNSSDRLLELSTALHLLPNLNGDVLSLLVGHLSKVAQNSEKNSMNADNLGIVFAPSLFPPQNQTVSAIMTTRFTSIIVSIMIRHYDQLFPLNTNRLLLNRSGGSRFTDRRIFNNLSTADNSTPTTNGNTIDSSDNVLNETSLEPPQAPTNP